MADPDRTATAVPPDADVAEAIADPRTTYRRRLTARRSAVERWLARDDRLVQARTVTVLALAGLVTAGIAVDAVSVRWTVVPLAVFVALLVVHDRVRARLADAKRAAAFYARGLERLEHRWAAHTPDGARFLDRDHPYAADLDLFGPGSLFQLLCTARTAAGEETLAAWLGHPAKREEVLARQAAVDELRDRLGLREALALLGADVRAQVDPTAIVGWGRAEGPTLPTGLAWPLVALVLAVTNIAALLGWLLAGVGPLPLVFSALAAWAVSRHLQQQATAIIAGAEEIAPDLDVVAALLARIEDEPAAAPWLTALRDELLADGTAPSAALRALKRRIDLLEARTSPIWAPVAVLVLWGTQLALALERWRARHGESLARWLDAVGRYEALTALASYAFEHPSDPFAEIVAGGARYEAEAVAHPLLPADEAVPNDVCLGGPDGVRVLLVTGSNMSGKSTLLRTVGVSAVLALAGTPVRARRLRISVLSVGAAIRIQDSLQAHVSHFYAEITRLRQIVALAEGERPALFLADEILEGTNSRDRRVGTAAVLRRLLRAGAVGLATTHDLQLAELADELAPAAVNVHFRDHLEAGEMAFDYRLHEGPVRTSNALDLMRAVGLLADEGQAGESA